MRKEREGRKERMEREQREEERRKEEERREKQKRRIHILPLSSEVERVAATFSSRAILFSVGGGGHQQNRRHGRQTGSLR